MKDCPCGAVFPYTDCCGPLIRGVSYADTAEDLMRSRYTAFAQKEWAYLDKTRHPDEKKDLESASSSLRSENIRWTKLEILETQRGGSFDEEGTVRFIAYYTEDGEEKTLQETSKFFKQNGKWYYSEKQSQIISPNILPPSSQPFKRDQPKVGRNDPCPCGSNKKYKKCCGR